MTDEETADQAVQFAHRLQPMMNELLIIAVRAAVGDSDTDENLEAWQYAMCTCLASLLGSVAKGAGFSRDFAIDIAGSCWDDAIAKDLIDRSLQAGRQ